MATFATKTQNRSSREGMPSNWTRLHVLVYGVVDANDDGSTKKALGIVLGKPKKKGGAPVEIAEIAVFASGDAAAALEAANGDEVSIAGQIKTINLEDDEGNPFKSVMVFANKVEAINDKIRYSNKVIVTLRAYADGEAGEEPRPSKFRGSLYQGKNRDGEYRDGLPFEVVTWNDDAAEGILAVEKGQQYTVSGVFAGLDHYQKNDGKPGVTVKVLPWNEGIEPFSWDDNDGEAGNNGEIPDF